MRIFLLIIKILPAFGRKDRVFCATNIQSMALNGKIKLTWKADIENKWFHVYGKAENENKETKEFETGIQLFGDGLHNVHTIEGIGNVCGILEALWDIYKELHFEDIHRFLKGWISIEDPLYYRLRQIVKSDYSWLTDETDETDKELIEVYFDKTEVNNLISDIKTVSNKLEAGWAEEYGIA